MRRDSAERSIVPWLPRALVALVVVLGSLVVGHITLGYDLGISGTIWNGVYDSTGLLAGVACFAAARRHERLAWSLIGAGLALWAAGELYWRHGLADLESPPFPSIADALWLCVYPLLYAGILLLLRSRFRSVGMGGLLDGLIGSLAVVAVGTAVVLSAVAGVSSGRVLAVATNLAYPVADTLLLALVALAFTLNGGRADLSWKLVALGIATFAVTDSVYAYQIAHDTYEANGLVDSGWAIAPVVVAVAAIVPASKVHVARSRIPTLVMPSAFALVALGILVWDHFENVLLVSLIAATACIILVILRMALIFRENLTMLDERTHQAETDPLTGLANRRRLMPDLERFADPDATQAVLAIFDLNGFKNYNDAFGHPAGDALLRRLGRNLEARFAGTGTAYRMGGDEFCVLVTLGDHEPGELVVLAADALSEEGQGFRITAAAGHVVVPTEAVDPIEALRLADHRMYANKNSGRATPGEQSMSVLLAALLERSPDLGDHLDGVSELAVQLALGLGLEEEDVENIRIAAALHDVGKIAVPESILSKPAPLDPEEWEFVRRHTLAGETIMQAAPSLNAASKLVRSSHERWDGQGYPDQLVGKEIPLGSRIIAVCDAFDAMISARPYSASLSSAAALEELVRHSGGQFDPEIVARFGALVAERANRPERPAVELAA